jgi:hypothetical protein
MRKSLGIKVFGVLDFFFEKKCSVFFFETFWGNFLKIFFRENAERSGATSE